MSVGPAPGQALQAPANLYQTQGDWTPVLNAFVAVGDVTVVGKWTKTGTQVFVWCSLQAVTSLDAVAGTAFLTGLPFPPALDANVVGVNESTFASLGVGVIKAGSVFPPAFSAGAGEAVILSGWYQT